MAGTPLVPLSGVTPYGRPGRPPLLTHISMPPRIKSCLHCRVAKAKCSLSDPCVRCVKRNLDCQYPSSQPNCNGTRRIRIIKPALRARTRNGVPNLASLNATNLEAGINPLKLVARNTPAPARTENVDTSTIQLRRSLHSGHAAFSTHLSYEGTGCEDMEALLEEPLSPSWFEGLDLTSASRISDEIGRLEAFTQLAMPHQSASTSIKALESQLSQRTRSIQQGSLTAKMVFTRLSDYTRMLADGRELPPFIYPPCCFNESARCFPGSPHHCLPETLAVCANLTRIFQTCVPESRGYAWHQIRLHLHHLDAYVSNQRCTCGLIKCKSDIV